MGVLLWYACVHTCVYVIMRAMLCWIDRVHAWSVVVHAYVRACVRRHAAIVSSRSPGSRMCASGEALDCWDA